MDHLSIYPPKMDYLSVIPLRPKLFSKNSLLLLSSPPNLSFLPFCGSMISLPLYVQGVSLFSLNPVIYRLVGCSNKQSPFFIQPLTICIFIYQIFPKHLVCALNCGGSGEKFSAYMVLTVCERITIKHRFY